MLEEKVTETVQNKPESKVCGIVMPISPIDGYPVSQWKNVQSLLEEVIESTGLRPNLVSNSDEVINPVLI